jgi:hypothetical protein
MNVGPRKGLRISLGATCLWVRARAVSVALSVTIVLPHESARFAAFLSTSPNRCSPSPKVKKPSFRRLFGKLQR